ncbi:MAG: site-specific integrase [Pseudohongiella sp.]|nr:site-specific integrase [Pseudohongiella sp.]
MPRNGKARILSREQKNHVLSKIKVHRHAEKNIAIMQVSFNLGLRVQEIAFLEVKDVADMNATCTDFKLFDEISLSRGYRNPPPAPRKYYNMKRPVRRSVTFELKEFEAMLTDVWNAGQRGEAIDTRSFYPDIRVLRRSARVIPMVEGCLREALENYLRLRIESEGKIMPSARLFITQKGGAYSPDTLQRHMATILRDWSGIEDATSHSGRRTLISDIVRKHNGSIKAAQYIAGHVIGSTTLNYDETPEFETTDVISRDVTNSEKVETTEVE